VMYLGKLVETAPSEELYARPLHPYTQVLLSNALPAHPDEVHEEVILPGEVPSPLNPPSGCHFHPRCPYALPICSQMEPALREAAPGHAVACHIYFAPYAEQVRQQGRPSPEDFVGRWVSTSS
jgi:peptide/nickel transport system ATP-binding protein